MSIKYYESMPSYSAAEVFYVRVDPGISVPDELLKALYYLLWFPGYFGFNWDALYDCLNDFEWIPAKIVVVHERLPNFVDEDLKIYLKSCVMQLPVGQEVKLMSSKFSFEKAINVEWKVF